MIFPLKNYVATEITESFEKKLLFSMLSVAKDLGNKKRPPLSEGALTAYR